MSSIDTSRLNANLTNPYTFANAEAKRHEKIGKITVTVLIALGTLLALTICSVPFAYSATISVGIGLIAAAVFFSGILDRIGSTKPRSQIQ